MWKIAGRILNIVTGAGLGFFAMHFAEKGNWEMAAFAFIILIGFISIPVNLIAIREY